MGASLSPLVTDFPRDSSHFAEKASDPYIEGRLVANDP